MVLFEHFKKAEAAIAGIGEEVRAEAQATNTNFSYCDPNYGSDVITEYPDGTRTRKRVDGIIEQVPPRAR